MTGNENTPHQNLWHIANAVITGKFIPSIALIRKKKSRIFFLQKNKSKLKPKLTELENNKDW